jgi:hypothetical protein
LPNLANQPNNETSSWSGQYSIAHHLAQAALPFHAHFVVLCAVFVAFCSLFVGSGFLFCPTMKA